MPARAGRIKMAFIGLVGVLLFLVIAAGALLLAALGAIIIGTVLVKRTEHKKLGRAIRILGITVFIPIVIIAGFIIVNKFVNV